MISFASAIYHLICILFIVYLHVYIYLMYYMLFHAIWGSIVHVSYSYSYPCNCLVIFLSLLVFSLVALVPSCLCFLYSLFVVCRPTTAVTWDRFSTLIYAIDRFQGTVGGGRHSWYQSRRFNTLDMLGDSIPILLSFKRRWESVLVFLIYILNACLCVSILAYALILSVAKGS